MLIEKVDEINLYENPIPTLRSRQAVFPGLVLLPCGELVALFAIGEAFESADMRTYVSRSKDMGKTWQFQGELYDQRTLMLDHQFSDCYKPTLLRDGRLAAIGYGFDRSDAEMPLADPESNTLLAGSNAITFSEDGGRTWSVPRNILVCGDKMLELSGPCVQLGSGKLIAAGAPFTLNSSDQEGWVIESGDNGLTWSLLGKYFVSPNKNIAPWETRICEMQPGRIAALFWAFDVLQQKHLPNHISISHDGGKTWSQAVDTGHMGQASNLLWLGDDKLLTIHAHRAGEVGLYIRCVDLRNDLWRCQNEFTIWGKAAAQNTASNIIDQFASLKFGQPSLLRLNEREFLATHWCVEDCIYKIKTHRLIIKF